MNDYSKKSRTAFTAALAVLLMLCASAVLFADDADASGEDLTGYGAVNTITLAPGYSWSYTPAFPADLADGMALSLQVNEMPALASITGGTLTISEIPDSYAGSSYNIVIKAYHAESEQTAYQWIRVVVNQVFAVSSSGCVEQIVLGTSQDITLSSTGGIGTVTWSVVGDLPAGLSLSGNKVTGTPTQVGANSITVKATSSEGESKTLNLSFTVFNVIKGGDAQTLTAIGGQSVASSAIVQTGSDLGVTWAVTSGTLPAGLTLNASTGVVSGTYTGSTAGQAVVTLTGTAANGPAQTATKTITIDYEPAFAITGGDSRILTWTGNTADKTVALGISADASDIIWSVPATAGITVSQTGVLTVTGAAAVTSDGSIVVTATSANGQTATKTVQYLVEDTLTITGASKLVSTQSVAKSADFTISGGSSNTVAISNSTYGDALTFSDGKLTVSSPSIHAKETVTLTATSAAGQTASCTVDVQVFTTIGFSTAPGADGIITFTRD